MIQISKEEFMAILDRQQRSGLTIRDFCSNEAYSVSGFHYWKKKFGLAKPYRSQRNAEIAPSGIAPVSIKPVASESVSTVKSDDSVSGEIVFKFPGGVEVSFTGQRQTEIALQVLNQIYSTYVLAK